MTERDKAEAVNVMFEGILAAFYATVQENNDQFSDCKTFAHAAMASLESAGFTVVRNA